MQLILHPRPQTQFPSEIDVARSDVIIPDQGMCPLTEVSELGVVIYIPLRVVFEKRRCISLRLWRGFIKTVSPDFGWPLQNLVFFLYYLLSSVAKRPRQTCAEMHSNPKKSKPTKMSSPWIFKVRQQEKATIKAKKRHRQNLSTQMFISEIFATKNSAKTKEIRWPKKPKKQRKKQSPTPPQELISKACATSVVEGWCFFNCHSGIMKTMKIYNEYALSLREYLIGGYHVGRWWLNAMMVLYKCKSQWFKISP